MDIETKKLYLEDGEHDIWEAYIRHVKAYLENKEIYNEYTNKFEEPNEVFMRKIEEEAGIPEQGACDVRRDIFMYRGLGDHGARNEFVKSVRKINTARS